MVASSGTKVTVKSNASLKKSATIRKKICEMGSSCPYKNEYQHALEFSHDDVSTKKTSVFSDSKGQKLGRAIAHGLRKEGVNNLQSHATDIGSRACPICKKHIPVASWSSHEAFHARNSR